MYDYSVDQWILLFFLYSLAGYVWEVLYVSVRSHKWVNRGFLFGPILPIYGFGAITILHAAIPAGRNWLLVALFGAVAATILEYITGALMERLFGIRYWDYTNDPGNINGYICPRATIGWALFSVLLVRWVHPYFDGALQYFTGAWVQIFSHALMAGLAVDTTISARQALDFKALLQEMAEEDERLAAALARAERVKDKVDAKIAYLDMNGNGIPDVEELRARVADAKVEARARSERLRGVIERANERRPKPFAAAKRILRNNPTAYSKRFESLIERIREMAEEAEKNNF
ncbi:MAG: putative ABC transporter permease [Firmicutes bacterium]|nr:putative ABC transporter permease [Bacillota bacterium]